MAKGNAGRCCFIVGPNSLRTIGSMLVLAVACGGAGAQEPYPVKSVRMVVPFAAGGPTDTVARVMSAKPIPSSAARTSNTCSPTTSPPAP